LEHIKGPDFSKILQHTMDQYKKDVEENLARPMFLGKWLENQTPVEYTRWQKVKRKIRFRKGRIKGRIMDRIHYTLFHKGDYCDRWD
jgi:hypothetical protein